MQPNSALHNIVQLLVRMAVDTQAAITDGQGSFGHVFL
jgi:hypothetical protein